MVDYSYIHLDETNLTALTQYHIRSDGTLVGFAWNLSQQEQLHSIDPATGKNSVIGIIPQIVSLSVNIFPIDNQNNIIYQDGNKQGDPTDYLFEINPFDAYSSTIIPDRDFSALEVRSDGALVGLTWNWGTLQEELRKIEPDSGESTLIGIVNNMELLSPLVRAFDNQRNRIYQLGYIFNDWNTERIFVIDAYTAEGYYFTPDREFDILFAL